MLIDDGMYPLSDAFFEQLGDFMLRTGNTAGMALVAEVERLRAENRKLGKACENLIQELQRCAADGGGYSCAVVDEAREAIEGGPT